jgi:hypothetical protein
LPKTLILGKARWLAGARVFDVISMPVELDDRDLSDTMTTS